MQVSEDDLAPSAQQRLAAFADMRFGMFNHFGVGTFTDEEWALPHQSPALFAPTVVDCEQWAAAAVAAGMTYGILTTKHHDGFCLWPTKFTTNSVAQSGYTHDVVQRYVDAFRAAGLRVGLYFSIWDRTHGVEAYDTRHLATVDGESELMVGPNEAIGSTDTTYVLGQLRELLTNYGRIDVLVTDGWAWQMGQQAIPYDQVRALVMSLQPHIVMLDHGALSHPFLGDAIMFEEPMGITAPAGNAYAACQGQTISTGWFWNQTTPTDELMSADSIIGHLKDLEPKYTSFLLNCPPNREGRLDARVVQRLTEVGAAWSPNWDRPVLPSQPFRCEYPVTPVNAYGSVESDDHVAANAIAGFSDKNFETCWSTAGSALPQEFTIDLGGTYRGVCAIEYLPVQWNRSDAGNGDITECVVLVGVDGIAFSPVARAEWTEDSGLKFVEWPEQPTGFVRLRVVSATGGFASIAHLRVGGRLNAPHRIGGRFAENELYRITSAASNDVVGVDAAGYVGPRDSSPVVLGDKDGCHEQRWSLSQTADGYFIFRHASSGLLMRAAGTSRANGAAVAAADDDAGAQSEWALTVVDPGCHAIVNRFNGLALEVVVFDGVPQVQQRRWTGGKQQHWSIELAANERS